MSTTDLIYDIGLHNGDDTAYYLQRAERVIAVEANPELASAGARRFAREVETGRLVIVNKGIADAAGTMDFWVNPTHTEWSSFSRELAGRNNCPVERVPVEAVPLVEVIRTYGMPAYIKIDIEGHDHVCLKAFTPACKPRYISVEFSGDGLLDELERLGYRHFKCICQFTHRNIAFRLTPQFGWFETVYSMAAMETPMARKAQELCGVNTLWDVTKEFEKQLKLDYAKGSSGPFGEETDGQWLGAEALRELFRQTRSLSEARGSMVPSWCDLHAKA